MEMIDHTVGNNLVRISFCEFGKRCRYMGKFYLEVSLN